MQAQELIEHLEEKKKRAPLFKRWWMKQILGVVKTIVEAKGKEAADKVIKKL